MNATIILIHSFHPAVFLTVISVTYISLVAFPQKSLFDWHDRVTMINMTLINFCIDNGTLLNITECRDEVCSRSTENKYVNNCSSFCQYFFVCFAFLAK